MSKTFLSLLLLTTLSSPAATLTLPGDRATTEGNLGLPMGGLLGPNTTQVQVAASELAALGLEAGYVFTGLRWRLNGGATPNAAFTIADLEITLGEAANVITAMSTTLANNFSSSQLVYDGSFSAGAGDFPSGGTPNAFGPLISFSSGFTYQGGDLVIQLRRMPASGALLIDSSNDHAGVGTDYRTLSNGVFAATTGTFISTVPLMQFEVTTPEPGTWGVVGGALALLGVVRRRK